MNVPSGSDELMRFDGQTAIVTGAGRGIGRSYALLLAERGACVVVNDRGVDVDGTGRSQGPADDVVAEITRKGGIAVANCSDISAEKGVLELVEAACRAFGPVDLLIHNAGFNIGDLDPILNVHLRAAWWLAEEVWPEMLRRHYGRIILTTSSAGLYGDGTGPEKNPKQAYVTAKAGVVGLTKALAIRGRPANILVNAVSPSAYTRLVGLNRGITNTRPGAPPPTAAIEFSKANSPTELVAAGILFLMHSSCPVTGRVFNVGTGRVAEVFSGVTAGYVAKGHLTPEEVRDNFDRVVDRTDFNVPIDMGDHGSWVRQVIAERRDDAWEDPGTLHSALGKAPSVAAAQRSLRRQIVRGLDQRAVEVVVLRHAAGTGNAHCWEQHRRPATEAGIAPEEIRAIASADRDALSDDDRLMVELVDGVLGQRLADEVRDEVKQRFGSEQLVQFVMLVGYYSMIGQAGYGLMVEGIPE